jgi:hypothetical protein
LLSFEPLCCDLVVFEDDNKSRNVVERYDESPETFLREILSVVQRWNDSAGKLLHEY